MVFGFAIYFNMNLKICFCIVLIFIAFTKSSVLPVEKCNLEDSACMTSAFQKAVPIFFSGIPELGIEVQDLLEMDDVKFDLAGFQFSLKNGRLKGMKNAVIDDVKWDLKKKTFKVIYHLDCSVTGDYTAGGRILILPISGDGDMKLTLKNIQLQLLISYEIEKGSDGKDHIAPKNAKFDFEVKDNTHFHLGNLFNGNKELSDSMLKFLNENWQQVSTEFGRPLIDAALKKIFKNIVKFFIKNAIEDIAKV